MESSSGRKAKKPQPAADASKAEMEQAARKMGIKGRSQMNRDELASAVKRAKAS